MTLDTELKQVRLLTASFEDADPSKDEAEEEEDLEEGDELDLDEEEGGTKEEEE